MFYERVVVMVYIFLVCIIVICFATPLILLPCFLRNIKSGDKLHVKFSVSKNIYGEFDYEKRGDNKKKGK